jgi:hypothetical protein
MHKVHIIAVHAEDRQDAINQVDAALEEYYMDVYDWFEVGGRWSDYFGDDDGEVLDVAANKDRAIECLKNLVTEMDNRFQDNLDQHYKLVKEAGGVIRPDALTSDWAIRIQQAYYLRNIANILGGAYSFGSNFYCLNDFNACPKFYLDRFPEDLTGLYFVAVDMHM